MAKTTVYPIPGYPTTHVANDGTPLTIRPMVPGDKKVLTEFFSKIPERDRFYLKDDVTSPAVIEEWAENVDYNRVVPLLALDGDRVVAEGTLHHRREGARRHVGEARVVVGTADRKKGIGRGMLHKLAELGAARDLERLVLEIFDDAEPDARQAAMVVGFRPIAVLHDHVRDMGGTLHDMTIMEMRVDQQIQDSPDVY